MKILKILKKAFRVSDFLKSSISFAQEGEDLLLADLFGDKKNGFYVDVGAYDPVRFSNTKMFYDRGWSGVNIEPNLEQIKKFYKKRPRDTNLCYAVGKKGTAKYFEFQEGALNTFSADNAQKYLQEGYALKSQYDKEIRPLSELIDAKKIDFMTIDVEGLEMEVLLTMNWDYPPEVMLIEIHGDIEDVLSSQVYHFLKNIGYSLIAKTRRTCIFTLRRR